MFFLCLDSGIYQVLLEKESCPKCFSTKCGIDDLLPNVSLRQAIEHFLESQILTIDSGNECQRYAPGMNLILIEMFSKSE